MTEVKRHLERQQRRCGNSIFRQALPSQTALGKINIPKCLCWLAFVMSRFVILREFFFALCGTYASSVTILNNMHNLSTLFLILLFFKIVLLYRCFMRQVFCALACCKTIRHVQILLYTYLLLIAYHPTLSLNVFASSRNMRRMRLVSTVVSMASIIVDRPESWAVSSFEFEQIPDLVCGVLLCYANSIILYNLVHITLPLCCRPQIWLI